MAGLLSLDAFLADERRQGWQWGTKDCCCWVCDWIAHVTGIDPAGPYRGAYTTADEARELIKREGGFVPFVGMRMDQCGFNRTQSPRAGDVAIVSAPISLCDRMPVVGTIFAIAKGDGVYVARGLRGMHYERWPLVTGWDIGPMNRGSTLHG